MLHSARSAAPSRALVLGLVLFSLASAAAAETITGLRPSAALKPGLAVTYHFELFRHVDELEKWAASNAGEMGAPIPMLNYAAGPGNVLTSGRGDGVGAVIEGLINFAETGTYELMVLSNDGVRMEIGGKLVHTDPEVHVDRFSDPVVLEVDSPGWYPLSILYFERKGTATLELYWLPPSGGDRLEFVPAAAFAHLPK